MLAAIRKASVEGAIDKRSLLAVPKTALRSSKNSSSSFYVSCLLK